MKIWRSKWGRSNRCLIAALLVQVFVYTPSAAQEEQGPGWVISMDPGSSLYISLKTGSDLSKTIGPGWNLKVHYSLHEFFSLGILFENYWLYTERATDEYYVQEHDVQQQHYVVFGRLRLYQGAPEINFELGLGLNRYSGMVDIPEEEYCFGCGKYDGTSYRPTLHTGVFILFPLVDHLFFKCGFRYILNLNPIIGEATDVHNFISSKMGIGLDVGFAVRI